MRSWGFRLKLIESLKGYIFIATTAVGITLYVHQTFATNVKVDKISSRVAQVEQNQNKQNRISCLIAYKLKVAESDLRDICNLNFK